MQVVAQTYPLGQPRADAADGSLSVSFSAVAQSLACVRDAVAMFALEAGASQDALESIRLVCSEAAANVVEHAYSNSDGEIHLRAIRNSEALWFVVADHGEGLVLRPGKRSAGFGFGWMARFSDAMTLDPVPGGGLEITFRFELGRSQVCDASARGER